MPALKVFCQNHLEFFQLNKVQLIPSERYSNIKIKGNNEQQKAQEKMSASGAISKKDIEILAKQVMFDRKVILSGINENHLEISNSLLPDNVRNEYSKRVEKVNAHDGDNDIDNHPISLDEFEAFFTRLDRIDRALHSEGQSSNAQTAITTRKPNETMKRMGSMTDVNRPIYKSSSMMNLTTKIFAEPRLPPPPPPKSHSNKSVHPSQLPEIIEDNAKCHVPLNMLEKFNALKDEVQGELASIDDHFSSHLETIWNKLEASTRRLNQFFEDFNKMKTLMNDNKNVEDGSLQCLDNDLLEKLKQLNEVSEITENRFLLFEIFHVFPKISFTSTLFPTIHLGFEASQIFCQAQGYLCSCQRNTANGLSIVKQDI